MDSTRTRNLHALLCGAVLLASSTGVSAALAEAQIEFGWLSAFQFETGSDMDTGLERGTIVYSGVDDDAPTLLDELDWVPLAIESSSSMSFARAEVTSELAQVDMHTNGGEAVGYAAVAGLLTYTGL